MPPITRRQITTRKEEFSNNITGIHYIGTYLFFLAKHGKIGITLTDVFEKEELEKCVELINFAINEYSKVC